MSETVGDDFPKQQARIRECLKYGQEIGPAGAFYCAMAKDLLKRADEASIGGDIIAILRVYQEMKEFES